MNQLVERISCLLKAGIEVPQSVFDELWELEMSNSSSVVGEILVKQPERLVGWQLMHLVSVFVSDELILRRPDLDAEGLVILFSRRLNVFNSASMTDEIGLKYFLKSPISRDAAVDMFLRTPSPWRFPECTSYVRFSGDVDPEHKVKLIQLVYSENTDSSYLLPSSGDPTVVKFQLFKYGKLMPGEIGDDPEMNRLLVPYLKGGDAVLREFPLEYSKSQCSREEQDKLLSIAHANPCEGSNIVLNIIRNSVELSSTLIAAVQHGSFRALRYELVAEHQHLFNADQIARLIKEL